MSKKIIITQEDYDLIIAALNLAAENEQKNDPEINWYAETIDNLDFAWEYGTRIG